MQSPRYVGSDFFGGTSQPLGIGADVVGGLPQVLVGDVPPDQATDGSDVDRLVQRRVQANRGAERTQNLVSLQDEPTSADSMNKRSDRSERFGTLPSFHDVPGLMSSPSLSAFAWSDARRRAEFGGSVQRPSGGVVRRAGRPRRLARQRVDHPGELLGPTIRFLSSEQDHLLAKSSSLPMSGTSHFSIDAGMSTAQTARSLGQLVDIGWNPFVCEPLSEGPCARARPRCRRSPLQHRCCVPSDRPCR